ncbi:EAL domain-containing protein (putative c-di-GMP-specific phosphodiesterase class I) [Vreelandella songnenensis]|uniref:EAL domain-containing protein (Putative c-di-GMP-specific phosphodiesterase class I) n=1 Tax=Vreelandella songnenensis TaxID=1176243 RepID=A0A2T0V5G0_9GAMM|nr:EAL domain-containing response regulator [Halomonas songnenensis]PRY65308.1 EAL domain-containing protein (putative c-di-GMP-specific phosphodiesterase class I) [Halomonas songnenensis]
MLSNALVIDDDPDIQRLGELLLIKHGFSVAKAGSLGELARQPALLNAELILLDIGLGEFTALDILDYLHDLRLKASILFISSCSKETAAAVIASGKAKGFHVLGFLPKSKLISDLSTYIEPLKHTPKAPTEQELSKAITDDQIFLAFQPQIDLQNGRVIGAEALVRWHNPERGVLYPDSFIRLAEQSGLILPLTWRVIELALKQQAQWQAQQWELNVAINIPAAFIKAEGMLDAFNLLTHQHHSALGNISLELTETAGVECLGYACHILKALRQLGCQLALDDFGTGYSSLTQLYRLPFNELKIDRSFVSRIDQDKDALAITLAIISLGKSLGLTVIAEGIETAAQHAMLVGAGCTVGQGYFIARPLTAGAFNAWMCERSHSLAQDHEESMPLRCNACRVTECSAAMRAR